jgi:2-keto-4-pentenoate hydratase/2-oxohepta-3-ene-1,7-dioic acid hydratase in catechol pathway
MKIYQLLVNQEPVISVEVDRGLIDLTGAFQLYNFFKKNRTMVKVNYFQDFIQLPNYSEDLILRVFDFLEAHNLWEKFLIKSDYKILAPIQKPGKIIAIGLNYVAHAHEGGKDVPTEPIFFDKAGSVVIGQDDKIEIPDDIGRVDHEIELAVIIGKKAQNVKQENCADYIAGYTIFNDITARDLQKQAKQNQQPWFRSKNFDTFGPMGPCVVTKTEMPLPINLEMELSVNEFTQQKSSTENMVFKIPQLMAYITKYLTLYPGDLISTGTPEGISELHDGDIIEAEIERIGVLRNRVIKVNKNNPE